MKKLLKNKKGFTLMEMLIVVAIIVILVGVSMPIFSNKIDDARKAADDANERAAKAVATAEYLSDNPAFGDFDEKYTYDIVSGTLKPNANGITPYGKSGNNKNKVIKVTWDNGNVKTAWE